MKLPPSFNPAFFYLTVTLVILIHQPNQYVTGAKILFLSFVSTSSHQNIYEPLLLELAKRDHEVTLVTPIKTRKSVPNFHEINTPSIQDYLDTKVRALFHQKGKGNPSSSSSAFNLVSKWEKFKTMPFLQGERFASICRQAYEDEQVKELIASKKRFDLIFLKTFQNECTYGLAHYLNTTTVLITTVSPFRWNVDAFGGFCPPSFVPGFSVTFGHDMDFIQRLFNFLGELLIVAVRHFVYLPIMEGVYREYLGDGIPSSYEIERNASLLLMNTDSTLNYPRPHLPAMIEVGGMHLTEPKPLPKDLEEFATGSAKHGGFIYFSMGSIVKSHMMPDQTRRAFLAAFSRLKQRIIWKWETDGDGMEAQLPENVKIMKWLPQQDLLAHEQIRAFITHGGLLSIQEATYHGVPLVGIPMFGDQSWNMKQAETSGFALTLEFELLDEKKIFNALLNITEDPKYLKRAQELSKIVKDRLHHPLDTAVYWVEYVLRHQGAPHLQTVGRHLNFCQYHSLDVIATFCVISALFSVLLLFTVKLVLKSIRLRFFTRQNVQLRNKKYN